MARQPLDRMMKCFLIHYEVPKDANRYIRVKAESMEEAIKSARELISLQTYNQWYEIVSCTEDWQRLNPSK